MGYVRLYSFIALALIARRAFANDEYKINLVNGAHISKQNEYNIWGNVVKMENGQEKIICSFPEEKDRDTELKPNSGKYIVFQCGNYEASYYIVDSMYALIFERIDLILNIWDDHGTSVKTLETNLYDSSIFLYPSFS